MEKNSKKSIIIGITSLLLVTLILVGLTYAYYRTRIIGNNSTDPSVSVLSKKLEIVYSDGTATMNMTGLIEPNFEATKAFSVENTGDEKISFGIKLDNMTNGFTRNQDWTFTVTQDGEVIKDGTLPNSNAYIVNSIEIDSKATHNYVLTIKYNNSEEDQSVDMGATLTFRVNIDEEIGTVLNTAEEGTLLAAIGNNNLIQEPLTIPGQDQNLYYYKDFENYSNVPTAYASKTFIYGTGYDYDESTGKFTLTGVSSCVYNECYNKLEGKYLASNAITINTSSNLTTSNLTGIYEITSAEINKYSFYTINKLNRLKKTEALLAATEDDYGTSYYFRGTVENNFVNYSGMCWRILRVQGNGTIKLVLADEDNECNNGSYSIHNTGSALADGRIDINYGDDLGTQPSLKYIESGIPEILTEWKEKHSLNEENIINAEWCNDLSVVSEEYLDFDGNIVDEPNMAVRQYYGGSTRLNKPSLKCNFIGINNTKAEKIEDNIGILTADEVMFAGETKDRFSVSYLQYNSYSTSSTGFYHGSWTMTPYWFSDYTYNWMEYPSIYTFNNYGYSNNGKLYGLLKSDYYDDDGVRPSIVLNSTVKAITNADIATYGEAGTYTNPYIIN